MFLLLSLCWETSFLLLLVSSLTFSKTHRWWTKKFQLVLLSFPPLCCFAKRNMEHASLSTSSFTWLGVVNKLTVSSPGAPVVARVWWSVTLTEAEGSQAAVMLTWAEWALKDTRALPEREVSLSWPDPWRSSLSGMMDASEAQWCWRVQPNSAFWSFSRTDKRHWRESCSFSKPKEPLSPSFPACPCMVKAVLCGTPPSALPTCTHASLPTPLHRKDTNRLELTASNATLTSAQMWHQLSNLIRPVISALCVAPWLPYSSSPCQPYRPGLSSLSPKFKSIIQGPTKSPIPSAKRWGPGRSRSLRLDSLGTPRYVRSSTEEWVRFTLSSFWPSEL